MMRAINNIMITVHHKFLSFSSSFLHCWCIEKETFSILFAPEVENEFRVKPFLRDQNRTIAFLTDSVKSNILCVTPNNL